ncbi:CRP/FNR family transcriptional regulator, anaerobic regulatory protein [Modicisalibacter muralis]|uniref:CRP/FNR family transcriptional regulator, anaerobic regulatory protein n=1 Tax=Modicisalibacter muralis TaxID=119000 RepID=A0A1G9QPE2_9GAMM|nr:fumarate/nitrate reduction transcriptional regulator Fnr [Halomonas muralis]SDM12902.1 CRP/FNR family transcriptional regulator, anaerobic regulatory protein [Halomonas muralis]
MPATSPAREKCRTCRLHSLCLPRELPQGDTSELARIVQTRRPMKRGTYVLQAGGHFQSIFAVRTGSVKTSTLLPSGDEHISGFHLPGEILGLDAIASRSHPSTSVTLETSHVCEIPFTELEHLSERIPALQRQLLRIMSRELSTEQSTTHLLARRSAEQRLAMVLLDFSQRFANRGLSARHFRLPMSRSDLANYLGLAPETMSRTFRRLEARGLLSIAGKAVVILDPIALAELVDGASGGS